MSELDVKVRDDDVSDRDVEVKVVRVLDVVEQATVAGEEEKSANRERVVVYRLPVQPTDKGASAGLEPRSHTAVSNIRDFSVAGGAKEISFVLPVGDVGFGADNGAVGLGSVASKAREIRP